MKSPIKFDFESYYIAIPAIPGGENSRIAKIAEVNSQKHTFENSKIAEPLIENQLLIVTCWTPNGNPIQVQAKDADHAVWLLRINPNPKA